MEQKDIERVFELAKFTGTSLQYSVDFKNGIGHLYHQISTLKKEINELIQRGTITKEDIKGFKIHIIDESKNKIYFTRNIDIEL